MRRLSPVRTDCSELDDCGEIATEQSISTQCAKRVQTLGTGFPNSCSSVFGRLVNWSASRLLHLSLRIMTGYTVHTGSNQKFSSGWDRIFSGDSPKKGAKSAMGAAQAGKSGKVQSGQKKSGKSARKGS